MAGHSHWAKVKYKKEVIDARKSQAFSKMARLITIATREGGEDPEKNPKLKLAIEKAKSINLPKENIERAIKRGIGELEGEILEEVIYEAYGPGKIALIIEGITNNKNRTFSEIKKILDQNDGKLVETGSVRWLFERKGVITIKMKNGQNKEELELKAIEAGAEDIYWHNLNLDIYTEIGDLERVKKNLQEKGIEIESLSLDWVAKEKIQIEEREKELTKKLFQALDQSEAVQEIYSNLKL